MNPNSHIHHVIMATTDGIRCQICFELSRSIYIFHRHITGSEYSKAHFICETCSKKKKWKNCPFCRGSTKYNGDVKDQVFLLDYDDIPIDHICVDLKVAYDAFTLFQFCNLPKDQYFKNDLFCDE